MEKKSKKSEVAMSEEMVWMPAFRSTWAYTQRVADEVEGRWKGRREFFHSLLDSYFAGGVTTRAPSAARDRLSGEEWIALTNQADILVVELRSLRRTLLQAARQLGVEDDTPVRRELLRAARAARARLRLLGRRLG
jgi:hypothetical protein